MELPALAQSAAVYLIGTPPLTPNSDVQPGISSSAPSLRTPRKPQCPQKSTSSESKRDSVIFSFRMVQYENEPMPSLSIRTTALAGSRVSKAKRRLFTRDYDSMDCSDLDIREKKMPRLSGLSLSKSRFSPTLDEVDGTDADDEMENTAFSTHYLSPPYSPPEESSVAETSPAENLQALQSQRNRNGSSVVVAITPKVKTCASCKTKKTPLWRDSDDGTPYCNACGIRFKKYHVRCSICFYIPRKDEKVNNSCCLCGSRLVHCRRH